ncbi:MAG: bifunctional biotin--[acetyl-CoA-carboxylase] ligase/biotin operon repressor BirA [Gammaproteobacteria bacterium]|nr:bifunctional biotin--[acetyl-CoA-carboxylase] ligase/biotin operon repressor BirA [Gammaproteobacteria bacterium]
MSTTNSVVILLRDNNFHSGEELAELLGISRAAVWKAIHSLRKKGLDIHSVRGKGYRLPRKMELLDKTLILKNIPPALRDKFQIQSHFELSSTNDFLLKYIKQDFNDISQVCLTEHQTHGRGRRGRAWYSPFGSNLYLSFTWRHKQSPQAVPGFSLVTALALAKSLELLGINNVGLKWPNDVLWNRKKLAGILLELNGEAHGDQILVIGIGVNVDMPENSEESINQPYTDISKASGKLISRNLLAAEILTQVAKYFHMYESEGMSSMIQEWQSHDAYFNEVVELTFPNQTIKGKVAGIDEHGSLLLDLKDGRRRTFQSGEISLRAH